MPPQVQRTIVNRYNGLGVVALARGITLVCVMPAELIRLDIRGNSRVFRWYQPRRVEEQKTRSCIFEYDDIAHPAQAEDALDNKLRFCGGKGLHVSMDDEKPSRQTCG